MSDQNKIKTDAWGRPITDKELKEEELRVKREKRANEIMSSSAPLYVVFLIVIAFIFIISKTGCSFSGEELIR